MWIDMQVNQVMAGESGAGRWSRGRQVEGASAASITPFHPPFPWDPCPYLLLIIVGKKNIIYITSEFLHFLASNNQRTDSKS